MKRTRLLLAGLAFCCVAATMMVGCSSKRKPELRVFIWSDYIDQDLVDEFAEEYECEVVVDNYASDEELDAKILQGGADYDVIFPSDRSLAALMAKKALQPLDRGDLPNFQHIDPQHLGVRHDPKNAYTVPYFWGTLAVGIRTDMIAEPVKGFEVLFDAKHKGKIVMLNDMEHDFAVALLHLGRPMNSRKKEDIDAAGDLLVRQQPWVQAYTSDEFKDKLIKGEAAAALGWNGDLAQARLEEPRIQVIVPESGTLLWVDSMAIPANAPNAELAHRFINYMLDPTVAARNANKVRYATTNRAAREKIDPKLLSDPAIYPPAAVLERCLPIEDRGREIEQLERLWRKVRQ